MKLQGILNNPKNLEEKKRKGWRIYTSLSKCTKNYSNHAVLA